MKKFGKAISLFLAACITLGTLVTSVAAAADLEGKIVVLYTANVRANIDVYPKMAALKEAYAARGAEVILADAGNFLQGTRYATYDSGKTIVAFMDAAGYDVAAIGSYEFAFGTGQVTSNHGTVYEDGSLGQFLAEASFDAVSANVMTGADSAYAPNTVITTVSGKTVGFFGITSPQTASTVSESGVRGLRFTDSEAAAQAQFIALSDCDIVIGLSNAGGISNEYILGAAPDTDMLVGALIFDGATGALDSHTKVNLDEIDGIVGILASVHNAKSAIDEATGSVAVSTVRLNGATRDVRAGESNLGNLWTDALRWFALEGGIERFYDEDDIANGNTGLTVDADHVIALWNGGNLRDSILPGEVTRKDISRVLPYPNTVAVVYLTGAQLLEHLEATSQALPFSAVSTSAASSFMQASGIRYHVAASTAYDAGPLYRTNWFTAQSVNRVTIQNINGRPFDPAATYAVITSNANYNGMDASYVCLDKGEDSAITSAVVTDVVWRYIQEKLNGIIGADAQYAAAEGRITIDTSYADIAGGSTYDSAVRFVTDNGIMRGTSSGDFNAEAPLTRADFIVALYKAAGAPAVELSETFEDVSLDAWYANAVTWAVNERITSGTSAITFSPDTILTRQELAVFIRNLQNGTTAQPIPAPDADSISVWSRNAVAYLYANGYLDSLGDAPFAPTAPASRGLVALVLTHLANQ